MKFLVEDSLPLLPDTFWSRVFFDRDYLDGLYSALSFDSFDLETQTEGQDGSIARTLKVVPAFHAPAIVRKHLGSRFYYREQGVFDPIERVFRFQTIPSVATEGSKIFGSVRAEAHPQGMRHVMELDVSVSVWGIGSLLERVAEKNVRDSFVKVNDFTRTFAKAHGLS